MSGEAAVELPQLRGFRITHCNPVTGDTCVSTAYGHGANLVGDGTVVVYEYGLSSEGVLQTFVRAAFRPVLELREIGVNLASQIQ